MSHLKMISLDDSFSGECERLRIHPGNVTEGEPLQIRHGGFFRYFDMLCDEHYHWGVSDGSSLFSMISLAVLKEEQMTVGLLTDFYSDPRRRQVSASRKLIRQVQEFFSSVNGPVLLLGIEDRYRQLDRLRPIAQRLGFTFKTDQLLRGWAFPCARDLSGVLSHGVLSTRLSGLSEADIQSVQRQISQRVVGLSWPMRAGLLARIMKIDPSALYLSKIGDSGFEWAILYSEKKYRTYSNSVHMNAIISDESFVGSAIAIAAEAGCEWLLTREPFPTASVSPQRESLKFQNRVFTAFRERDCNRPEFLSEVHLFQGMTL